jgi:RNA polymerase sigma-70 factor (ECF subfamily)
VPADTTALFVEHRGALLKYAMGLVGSRAQAEDLVQEAWLRFEEAARQQILGEPLHYLFRIVRNLAFDGKRRQNVEDKLFRANAEQIMAALPDPYPTAEVIATDKDNIRRLQAALLELPPRTRMAFEMHRIEGRTLREVAAALGVSVPLAHVLVMEGLQLCKKRLRWKQR